IVLSSTLPATLLTPLRQLFFASKLNDKGFLTGAAEQIQIAGKHTGFLRDAVGGNDFTKAQLHAEHIINLLDGKTGPNYYDWNRNGRPENPGDGFGVRVYLEEAEHQLITTTAVLSTTSTMQDLQNHAQRALAAIKDGQAMVEEAEE